jgi:integrase
VAGGKGKRRGNGEGSIYKRKDGRWEGRYTVQTPQGPKRKSVFARTRAEAAKKLAKAIADADGVIVVDEENLTVEEYLERWLDIAVRDNVSHRTEANYRLMVRNHVVPALGRVKLKKLDAQRIQSVYRRLQDEGKHATARYVHATLHRALGQALRWGMVPANAAAAVTPPKIVRSEVDALSKEQVDAFFQAARGDRFEALYVLAVHTGLRQGELLGLKWSDLDLAGPEPSLRLVRQLQRVRGGGGLRFSQTKTKKGRHVSLTPSAVAALQRHRAKQAEERLAAGPLYEDQGLVFATLRGTPLEATNIIRRSYKPLLRQAGLPDIRFHDLRHTCATLLFGQKQHPKDVQLLLGHANVRMTLDTYSHAIPGGGALTAAAMERALAPRQEDEEPPSL